jgi:hypothetical protein
MIFRIERTSDRDQGEKPHPKAYKGEVLIKFKNKMIAEDEWLIDLVEKNIMLFVKNNGQCILDYDEEYSVPNSIEIYDGYRE